MNTVAEVMAELKKKGSPLRVRAFAPHGAPKDLFGVSVEDMKVIAKRIKGCTAPGFLDTRLRYAAWRSSYSSRASSGVRYASFSRRQHWL